MATISFKRGDEYLAKLATLASKSPAIAKSAVYDGAKIVADEIRRNLEALPADKFRVLGDGETFSGVPKLQKKDLLDSLGVSPIDTDDSGFINAKIGFDGYGSAPTQSYPKGVPNQLIARAVESGSSVREKTPFVRPAVNASRKNAESAMASKIESKIKDIMK